MGSFSLEQLDTGVWTFSTRKNGEQNKKKILFGT